MLLNLSCCWTGSAGFAISAPDDFDGRIAPLVSRIQSIIGAPFAGWSPFSMSALGLRGPLFKLIMSWMDDPVLTTPRSKARFLQFLDGRLYFSLVSDWQKASGPRFWAAPHIGRAGLSVTRCGAGWNGIRRTGKSRAFRISYRGCSASRRTGRADTLSRSAGLQGRFAVAFRYALGGPLEDASLAPPLLVSAGRGPRPLC